jgi:hypothetical protein
MWGSVGKGGGVDIFNSSFVIGFIAICADMKMTKLVRLQS